MFDGGWAFVHSFLPSFPVSSRRLSPSPLSFHGAEFKVSASASSRNSFPFRRLTILVLRFGLRRVTNASPSKSSNMRALSPYWR